MSESFDTSAFATPPAARGVFVAATDTEVGKTVIAGAVARLLSESGRRVASFKPAASGCTLMDNGELHSEDAAFLSRCGGGWQSQDEVVPLRFAQPLAPNVAAIAEGRSVDPEDILRSYCHAVQGSDAVVVEGVGGLLCPISDNFWVIHLARLCRLPLVIVARPGLGTINHTLLTLHAARSAGLDVAGVVVNRYPADSADVSIRSNPEQIAMRGGVKLLSLVPEDEETSVERCSLGTRTLDALRCVEWTQLCGL